MPNYKTTLGIMRAVGMAEGVSFLLLMGIAMPLKYFAGMPEAVKWTGWLHGVLFILYGLSILAALAAGRISFWKSLLAFGGSLMPFGPFLMDRHLARLEELDASLKSK
jgi:integral membrane protein